MFYTGTIGSNCTALLDCSIAVNSSMCDPVVQQCSCLSGYYTSTDGTRCIARRVGDNCTTSNDCTAVISGSLCATTMTSATCECVSGFRSADNGTSCLVRKLSDSCATSADCSSAVNGSTCGVNATCTCLPGYQPLNPTECSISQY